MLIPIKVFNKKLLPTRCIANRSFRDNFNAHNCPESLQLIDGKKILAESPVSIEEGFEVARYEIIDHLEMEDLCMGLRTFAGIIIEHFNINAS